MSVVCQISSEFESGRERKGERKRKKEGESLESCDFCLIEMLVGTPMRGEGGYCLAGEANLWILILSAVSQQLDHTTSPKPESFAPCSYCRCLCWWPA